MLVTGLKIFHCMFLLKKVISLVVYQKITFKTPVKVDNLFSTILKMLALRTFMVSNKKNNSYTSLINVH